MTVKTVVSTCSEITYFNFYFNKNVICATNTVFCYTRDIK